MASEHDYDFFVIGGGSGGVRAGRIAAQHGARVAVAEDDRYGGTCVIRGCVPKKMFVYASEWSSGFSDARAYGWDPGTPSFDWPTLVANKDAAIARLEGIYVHLLEKVDATVYRKRARLIDKHTVDLGDEQVTADKILIATGARPFLPEIPGIEHAITSNEAFDLPELPKRVVVVGGGYIALEFAHIFSGLGCEVTVIHRGHTVLRGFDTDVQHEVCVGLQHQRIGLRLETTVQSIEKTESGEYRTTLSTGKNLRTDVVMFATGRVPNTRNLGLEELGIETDDRGAILVNEYSKTSVDNVYAVGDCTPRENLTPVAIRDGHALADTLFGDDPRPVDHSCIPTAVFCQPPAATVGLTEKQARAEFAAVDIYKTRFRALQHSLPKRDEKVMMKLVVDGDTDRVLGAHVVGVEAAEIIQCVAIAVKMGATKKQFDSTIAIHPTTAEEIVTMRTKFER